MLHNLAGAASRNGRRAVGAAALLAGLLALSAMPRPAGAADPLGVIDITVTGLRNSDGVVRLAICGTPGCYEDQKGFLARRAIPADEKGVKARFEGLPPGAYSIMMFHDENGNNTFDKNPIGWPREGFGFSRNAEPGLSKPSYDEVVLDLDAKGIATTLIMQYW